MFADPFREVNSMISQIAKSVIVCASATLLNGWLSAEVQAMNLVNIDFNDLPLNTPLTDFYADQGVEFSLLGDAPISGPLARTINSTNYPLADGLGITPSTNFQEFFDIELNFSTAIDYFSILSLDSDEPITVTSYFQGSFVDSVSLPPGSNIQTWEVELGTIGGGQVFDRVVLDLVRGTTQDFAGGPEIFDNLVFNQRPDPHAVPEPLPNLLILLGMLGLAQKYRH
jgi:hypothetical protein